MKLATPLLGLVMAGKSLVLSLPNEPSAQGITLAAQVLVGPRAQPPFGLDFTNALLLTFGW